MKEKIGFWYRFFLREIEKMEENHKNDKSFRERFGIRERFVGFLFIVYSIIWTYKNLGRK